MKISIKLTGIVMLAGLVQGCALLSPTDPYVNLAAGRGPQPHSAAPAAQIKTVQGPLTLTEAIRVALANNPELGAVAADVDAAAAKREQVAGQRWPSLRAAGGYKRYADSQRLLGASRNGEQGVFSKDIFNGDLVLGVPLFTGGRISNEIKATDLQHQAASFGLARTRDELVFNVIRVFSAILAQRRVIASLKFSQEALNEHHKRVLDLISAQKAAAVDRLRIEVRMADLEQRLVSARNGLAVQTRVLANLLGLAGGQADLNPVGELALAVTKLPKEAAALQEALAQRADYLAARARLEAQAKAVDAARAAHWPTLTLEGGYGNRYAADPTDRPAGAEQHEDQTWGALSLSIPIFQGRRIKARVRQESARLEAAQKRLRKMELQIRLDVETALLNITAAAERVTATAKAIDQAKESLRIEREKHDLGKGSITDVLDAQSALLAAQTTYYRALADHQLARAQLNLALGEAY